VPHRIAPVGLAGPDFADCCLERVARIGGCFVPHVEPVDRLLHRTESVAVTVGGRGRVDLLAQILHSLGDLGGRLLARLRHPGFDLIEEGDELAAQRLPFVPLRIAGVIRL
jgi:hypothetical protein